MSSVEPLFSNERSSRDVVWVADVEQSTQLADVRTEILRDLLSVTVYPTALSCTRLAQKNLTVTQHFSGSATRNIRWNVLHGCCPGKATCGL